MAVNQLKVVQYCSQSTQEAWEQTQEILKGTPIIGQLTDMTPCQPIPNMPSIPIPCTWLAIGAIVIGAAVFIKG